MKKQELWEGIVLSLLKSKLIITGMNARRGYIEFGDGTLTVTCHDGWYELNTDRYDDIDIEQNEKYQHPDKIVESLEFYYQYLKDCKLV